MNAVAKKQVHLDILESLFESQSRVSAAQEEAFASIMRNGVPTLRTERWKYTSLRKAIHAELNLSDANLTTLNKHALIDALLKSDTSTEIVQIVNGKLFGEFQTKNALIQVTDEILEPKELHTDRFIDHLNLAFLRNNLQIQVTKVVEPLLIIHLHSNNENDLNAIQLSIDADDNCEAKILILHTSSAQANTQVPILTLDAGKNSDIEIYYCQELGKQTSQLGQTNILLNSDAVVSMVQLELGGELVRHNIIVDALESGAEFNLSSLFVQNDRQHIDTHLDMYHHAAHTQSTMLSKALLNDRARCVFNGKIFVERDAQQINAHLNNDTLLLSKYAEINTKPELEIYADDVKCAHGATVGQLDEQAIFYLRSRGLSQTDAESLLTAGFARSIYAEKVPNAMSNYLDTRLGFAGN